MKKPCSCPKGGMYEREDGSTYPCEKCGGSEYVSVHSPVEEAKKYELSLEQQRELRRKLDWYVNNPSNRNKMFYELAQWIEDEVTSELLKK